MNNNIRTIKEICPANSKFNIIQQQSQTMSTFSANYQLKERKVAKRQKMLQKKYLPMEENKKNLRHLYKDHNESIIIERQLLDKENYLKLDNYNNANNEQTIGNDNSDSSNNVLHNDHVSNDRKNSDCTGRVRCLQGDLVENQNDDRGLEQEQSIFCTAYNQYHTLNSSSPNIYIQMNSDSALNSRHIISKKNS